MKKTAYSSGLFQKFFNSERAGGLILICFMTISLVIANSPLGPGFIQFWQRSEPLKLGTISIPFRIEEWINNGLMSMFFLLVGLEVERELYVGELSSIHNAALPVLAAVGGMLVPALIHLIISHGKPEQAGFGIPMATDIAFSLGVLSLLGKRVPLNLKIFLAALAIIDDLGAVIIIAIFYTQTFSFLYFSLSLGLFGLLILFNRMNIFTLWAYLPAGLLLWYLLFRSGVHPTLSGILLALAIPFRKKMASQPSSFLQYVLHKPVNFLIIPLFVMANTAIHLPAIWTYEVLSTNGLAISAGLLLGKPIGITLFSLLAIKTGIVRMPVGMNTRKLFGIGIMGGIGFTISIFISNLAFPSDPELIQSSKITILIASTLAAVLGWTLFKIVLPKTNI
jgi:Na+:H+ antiporter, NhaA family